MAQNVLNEQEEKLYKQYQDIVAPFIAELEVRDSEYPIEIFNEIRAIFTHLSRYKVQGSESDIKSAENHMKRAILDCFKYLCISMEERVKTFRKTYEGVDLKLADNGKFLPELDRLETIAQKSYKEAKKAEVKKEAKTDELYEMFEKAYNDYSKLDKLLDDSHEAILFASTHSKSTNTLTLLSIIVTVVSIIWAVVATFFF